MDLHASSVGGAKTQGKDASKGIVAAILRDLGCIHGSSPSLSTTLS